MKSDDLRTFWNQSATIAREHGHEVLMHGGATEAEAAHELQKIAEILPLLGPEDLVVEPAAGAGRITPLLAERAGTVEAWDLVPQFLEENARRCAGRSNVRFVAGDATQLPFPSGVALVFTNWLLIYLDDEEARQFVRRAVLALKPGGAFFLRESCSRDETLNHSEVWLGTTYRASYRSAAWYRDELRGAAGARLVSLVEHDFDLEPDPEYPTEQRAWLLTLA